MKTQKVIETNVEYISGSRVFGTDDNGNFIFADTEESIAFIAKKHNASPEFITDISAAFEYFAELIVADLKKDLKDIWERLEEIERK